MPKQVKYNGVIHNFPDDATDDEIRQVLEQSDTAAIRQQQAEKYPTPAEQGAPAGTAKVAGARDVWNIIRKTNSEIANAPDVNTMMGPESALLGAATVGPAGEGLTVWQALKGSPAARLTKTVTAPVRKLLPSTERAAAKFEQVMRKAQDIPVDLGKANNALHRAQELEAHGSSSLPPVMKKFDKIQKPATAKFGGQRVTMQAQPMTYRTGRDFGSAASALSAEEKMKMAPAMKKQVADFAHALKTANREAAEKVGMGKLYDEAMREYASAKNLEDLQAKLAEFLARDAVKRIAQGVGIGLGYEAYDRLRK